MKLTKREESWIGKAQERLIKFANNHFNNWLQTKNGKLWRKRQGHTFSITRPQNSPYYYGFSLPEFHDDLIKAVGEGDEETAKYIMMCHYI